MPVQNMQVTVSWYPFFAVLLVLHFQDRPLALSGSINGVFDAGFALPLY
jgi:hypothetical protein